MSTAIEPRTSTAATWDRAGATWDEVGRTWDETLTTAVLGLREIFGVTPLAPMAGGSDDE